MCRGAGDYHYIITQWQTDLFLACVACHKECADAVICLQWAEGTGQTCLGRAFTGGWKSAILFSSIVHTFLSCKTWNL